MSAEYRRQYRARNLERCRQHERTYLVRRRELIRARARDAYRLGMGRVDGSYRERKAEHSRRYAKEHPVWNRGHSNRMWWKRKFGGRIPNDVLSFIAAMHEIREALRETQAG